MKERYSKKPIFFQQQSTTEEVHYPIQLVDENNLRLTDEGLLKEYRDQEQVKRIKKIFADFFSIDIKDTYSINGLYEFYSESVAFHKRRESLASFVDKQKFLFGLNHACRANKSQLIALARFIFEQANMPNDDLSLEQIKSIELNLYKPISAVLIQINNITQVSKQDLINQENFLINKKHIIDLNRLYDSDSEKIQTQASDLISIFVMTRDYKAVANLGSLLAEKKWYEIKLILDSNKVVFQEESSYQDETIHIVPAK